VSSGDEIALVFIVALLALSIVQSIRSWKARKPSRASPRRRSVGDRDCRCRNWWQLAAEP
jgi:hypothetical protein